MQIIQLTMLVEIEGISMASIFPNHNFNSLLEVFHTCQEATADVTDLTMTTGGVKG